MFTGTCNETNVGIRDELKIIPDDQMTASSNNGSDFLPQFGRLQGMKAWCPNISDADPAHLQIDLGQRYVICGVEAQGQPGASVTTSFTLSYSNNGSTFTDFNSNQVISYCQICHLLSMVLPPDLMLNFILIFLQLEILSQLETGFAVFPRTECDISDWKTPSSVFSAKYNV